MFVINYSHKINSINYTIFRRRNSYHCYRQEKTPRLCHCKTKNSHSSHIRGSSLGNAIAAEGNEDDEKAADDAGKADEAAGKNDAAYYGADESSEDNILRNKDKDEKKKSPPRL